MPVDTEQRLQRLIKTFRADGFEVAETAYAPSGRMGLVAEHRTARNYDTRRKRKAIT